MSYATALTWLFNFVLAISFPPLLKSFKPQGAFGFYAAWCLYVYRRICWDHIHQRKFSISILWVLILLFVRETKGKTLEELDQVFAVPAHVHAAYGLRQIPYGIRKWVLRQNVQAEQLYEMEDDSLPNDLSKKENVVHQEMVSDQVWCPTIMR